MEKGIMDMEKLLRDVTDQHNCARYQGAEQALTGVTNHIKTLVMDNKTPNQIAVSITKHLVEQINKYHMLINTTDMGSKMNKLKEKHEQK